MFNTNRSFHIGKLIQFYFLSFLKKLNTHGPNTYMSTCISFRWDQWNFILMFNSKVSELFQNIQQLVLIPRENWRNKNAFKFYLIERLSSILCEKVQSLSSFKSNFSHSFYQTIAVHFPKFLFQILKDYIHKCCGEIIPWCRDDAGLFCGYC